MTNVKKLLVEYQSEHIRFPETVSTHNNFGDYPILSAIQELITIEDNDNMMLLMSIFHTLNNSLDHPEINNTKHFIENARDNFEAMFENKEEAKRKNSELVGVILSECSLRNELTVSGVENIVSRITKTKWIALTFGLYPIAITCKTLSMSSKEIDTYDFEILRIYLKRNGVEFTSDIEIDNLAIEFYEKVKNVKEEDRDEVIYCKIIRKELNTIQGK